MPFAYSGRYPFTNSCDIRSVRLLSSVSSFMCSCHCWSIGHSFFDLQALTVKLGNMNLRIIRDEFTFVIVLLDG